jgi:Zn-dependent protease
MFSEPAETPMDLRFRLFGVPIRVSPWFWAMSVLLGWSITQQFRDNPFLYLGLWVACVFFSILLHEFGHVVMGWVFGSDGHILLHAFGGLAIGSNNLRSPWQRILVSAAGPGVQLLLYGALYFIDLKAVAQSNRSLAIVILFLLEINLYWPLLNLLPIWPLDGGQITRNFLSWLSPRNGAKAALALSAAVAALLAINELLVLAKMQPLIAAIAQGSVYMALLFGSLAMGSVQAMNQVGWAEKHRLEEDEREPWRGGEEDDADWWKRGRR